VLGSNGAMVTLRPFTHQPFFYWQNLPVAHQAHVIRTPLHNIGILLCRSIFFTIPEQSCATIS
jgi:hypothetical protein